MRWLLCGNVVYDCGSPKMHSLEWSIVNRHACNSQAPARYNYIHAHSLLDIFHSFFILSRRCAVNSTMFRASRFHLFNRTHGHWFTVYIHTHTLTVSVFAMTHAYMCRQSFSHTYSLTRSLAHQHNATSIEITLRD